MIKIIGRYKFLLAIFFIAAVLRFWQLGSVPPSPDWDEVALGYNAYSILKTGKDEYGTRFPLALRSYDDYKPPLYVYLTIPSIALFGLNVWAVRLPSVAFGLFAVAGTFFFVSELLQKWGKESAERIGLISSFFLAVSPWHINFSRIAFEANVGVTLNILGIACFLRGLRNKYFLWCSAILFALALYAYHSERIFAPILVIILAIAYRKKLFHESQATIVGIIIGILVVAPLVPVALSQNTLMRLRGTSALADETGLLARDVKKLEDDHATHNYLGFVFDNRRLIYFQTLVSGYLSHFSFNWWFINGDNPRHHTPDMGMLYFVELPILLIGIFTVARKKDIATAVLFGWFIAAPIAASPTTELPHGIRTLVFLPSFQIFSAIGFYSIYDLIRRKKHAQIILSAYGFLFLFNIFYFLHMYFAHVDPEVSEFWQYGYAQSVKYAEDHKDKYNKIIVSTELEQPHMFFLFYMKYDPVKYLQAGGTVSGGFAEVHNKFDIYEFRPIDWPKETKDGKTLYIGKPKEIPTSLIRINYLDGTEAIRIADH